MLPGHLYTMEENLSSACSFVPLFPHNPEHKHKQPQIPQSPEGFPPLEHDWMAEFETFPSYEGRFQLYSQLLRKAKWKGPNAHRALVVLHGQGEHCGRYMHWPHYLHASIDSIYLLDHRGHGRSRGQRGHVDYFDQYAKDANLAISRFYEYLLEKFGKAELHLLGHSMGGLIALRTVLNHEDLPLQSLTLSAPMIRLNLEVPKSKELAGKVLYRVAPRMAIKGEDLADFISSDPRVCQHYRNDPLNHGLVSSSFYYSYLEAKDDTLRRAATIQVPTLVQAPTADKIIDPASIVDLYKKLKGKQHKLIEYEGLFHELYNEPEREKVFSDLSSWLRKHREKSKRSPKTQG